MMKWLHDFDRTERSILGVALAALLVFSIFLYDDSLLFGQKQSADLLEIGAIQKTSNDVRRKNQTHFTWLPASSSQRVFQNDSIFTGDRSQAVVQLADGTQVIIEPNSLITLNINNGQMNLDLKYGQLESDISNSSLVIKSDGKEYQLTNTQAQKSKVKLSKNYSGNVDLKISAGQAQLLTPESSRPQVVTPEAPKTLLKTGRVAEASGITIQLLAPNKMEWVQNSAPLQFSWQNIGGKAKQERIEIAKDPEFKQVVKSLAPTSNPFNYAQNLEVGPYYWRVAGVNETGSKLYSQDIYEFSVSSIEKPKILEPLHLSILEKEIEITTPENIAFAPQLKWSAPPELTSFKVQLSKESDFARPLFETTTPQKHLLLPQVPSGEYHVRIYGESPDKKLNVLSDPVEFKVQLIAKEPARPDAPVLVTRNIEIPKAASRQPAAVSSPTIEWQPVKDAHQYLVQISDEPAFKNAQVKQITPQNKFVWSQYKPGEYYFRVFARNRQNLVSAPSETGQLTVEKGEIILEPVPEQKSVGATATAKQYSLNWSSVPYAQGYLLEVTPENDFSNPQRVVVHSPQHTLQVSRPGKLNVRVVGLDENNNEVTEFSLPQSVIYTHRNPLASPSLMEPFNKSSIFLQSEMEPFIWLEWRKVENASTYMLEISSSPNFTKNIIQTTVSANRFLIKEKLPLGKIYWRVRAVASDANEQSEWTTAREFTLFHQKNETFVK